MGSMSTQTITEFLEARIAEDEAMARLEDEDYADTTLLPTYDSEHQAAWNTDRVLAECAAKRAILAEHADGGGSQGYVDNGYGWIDHACTTCGTSGEYGEPFQCATIKAIAAIYADHIEFQQDWAL